MSIEVEVKGRTADRYRAYATDVGTRKPTHDEIIALAASGKRFARGAKVKFHVDEVAFEGKVKGHRLTFDAGERTVTRIVFYRGPAEEEAVVGSGAINASGLIQIELVEPPEDDDAGDDVVSGLDLTT